MKQPGLWFLRVWVGRPWLMGCRSVGRKKLTTWCIWVDGQRQERIGGGTDVVVTRKPPGPRGLWGPGVGVEDSQGSLPRLRSPSSRPPGRLHSGRGGCRKGGCRAAAPLTIGPASTPPPPSLHSAPAPAAIMICLVLTIFANLFSGAYSGVHERTFLAVKPDGVQRRLVGEIVRRFERKGFKLVALKLVQVKLGASEELLREHYAELRERPFYDRLVKYMGSGPVVAMVWQGLDVVSTSRTLIGATDPANALPGTVRGDFCIEVGKNVIHGSDSVESARREIALWFHPNELFCWEDSAEHWLYE
ncbi:nucleoside diphosphate kinase 3 isoform X3 [Artibeus jamaicensis]|uniref:nucleoside diphosphate kinase 3 isoform X3 n=1 Tax=Artibeus jamaicensis TaxID=9417 RepID=UPI00235B23B4|nr:nucleoside diphosphate kinase 3 isoform X3 [Artibeus jamaicensis]